MTGLLAGAYAGYLLFGSAYQNLYYDAENYWQLGHRFYQQGRFSLLAYDDALRGYAYPLVNFACLAVRKALDWRAVTVVKLLNAALAGGLFGLIGPRLWQVTLGQPTPPSAVRRLLWAALGFVFWGEYFNFSLSDFPALAALGLALWQGQRPTWGAALLAGLALALAINVRPIYQIAVPPAVLLLLLHSGSAWKPRLGLFALGAALVLTPQWLINRQQFGANTPLVLAQSQELHIQNLYLQKLKWGLLHQKYESSVGGELPTGQLLFLDPAGAALLRQEGLANFSTAGQYLRVVARHPGTVAGAYGRHLFAGLDISHPTPYLRRWAPSGLRQGLNYTCWFWAALVLVGLGRPTRRPGLVLGALLLPCLAVLPLSMEVRFLLPLHLLLLALVAFGPWPSWAVKKARLLVLAVAYGLFMLGCFALSAHITRAVEPRFQAYLLPAS